MWELIFHEAHHTQLLREIIPAAQKFVWIATADLKDMHVLAQKGKYRPFLAVLAELVAAGVEIRLIHAKEPGPRFRKDFDKYPELRTDRFERLLCPRLHMKAVIVDGKIAYLGSANFTGAGLGPKNANRRNFEAGVLTTDRPAIHQLMEEYDRIFLGNACTKCQLRKVCPDPIA
jgi:phosphatidylserine/phosphatidylglycerophosphate/cardiolipin synthase-like enzyme